MWQHNGMTSRLRDLAHAMCGGRHRGRTVVIDAGHCDVFASDRPLTDVAHTFAAISAHPDLLFRVTTTHPGRAANLLRTRRFWSYVDRFTEPTDGCGVVTDQGERILSNLVLGVPASTQHQVCTRLASLQDTPVVARFLEVRGPIDVSAAVAGAEPGCRHGRLSPLDFVVVADGAALRPADGGWVRRVHAQCSRLGIAFYVDGREVLEHGGEQSRVLVGGAR